MSFKQVSFRNWKLANLVSRKLACVQHSSNHPVLEFSNCLSYLLHSRASGARFLKALSCPPDWHPLYSSTLAGQASAAFWHRDERSSMVTFFTKCSHYTSLVSNKVTIVLIVQVNQIIEPYWALHSTTMWASLQLVCMRWSMLVDWQRWPQ